MHINLIFLYTKDLLLQSDLALYFVIHVTYSLIRWIASYLESDFETKYRRVKLLVYML